MIHKRRRSSFSRETKQTKALLRALVTSMLANGRVYTTVTKAKNIRPIVEKLVTKAKDKNLSSIRALYAYLYTKEAVDAAFVLGDKFKQRNGGYTRIVKGHWRKGDAAEMALIEFLD